MPNLCLMERLEVVAATPERLNQIATLAPDNPFLTAAYAEAQRRLGLLVWAFVLYDDCAVVRTVSLGFMRVGRLGCTLTFPSLVALPPTSAFWSGLEAFVKREHVTYIELESYAAPGAVPPPLARERARVVREEFLLDLDTPNILMEFSSTHRRWVRRAGRKELTLRRSVSPEALMAHNAMSRASIERHTLSTEYHQGPLAMSLETGAAELYQAMMHDIPISSVVVLRSPRTAYLMSAGTLDAGRVWGASHWLIHEIACALHREGVSTFNLGGARAEEVGLRMYKLGFGTTTISMEWVSADSGGPLHRTMLAAVGAVRSCAERVRVAVNAL